MDRMMIHPDVDDPDAHTLAKLDEHRRDRGTRLAVEGQPVELHGERVRHRVVGQHRPLLQDDPEVLLHRGLIGLLGMDNEEADQADHLGHGHVRVVEERAVLMHRELVGELLARHHEGLADGGYAIHLDGHLEPVPVDGLWLGESVLEDDPHAIALVHLDRRAGHARVVAPDLNDLAGHELRLDGLGHELEDLHALVDLVGELGHVEHRDGQRRGRSRRSARCTCGSLRGTAGFGTPLSLCPSGPETAKETAHGARDATKEAPTLNVHRISSRPGLHATHTAGHRTRGWAPWPVAVEPHYGRALQVRRLATSPPGATPYATARPGPGCIRHVTGTPDAAR